MKPFDIELAKRGKPVCTRDGRKARIICFDRITCDDYYKIVACVTTYDGKDEYVLIYSIDGYIVNSQHPKDEDLMMASEKKTGWINICSIDKVSYVYCGGIYSTKTEALVDVSDDKNFVTTIQINWEE